MANSAAFKQPKLGMRFRHARVFDPQKFDGITLQIYQVTKIAQGTVYFRPVYDYGEREGLGKPDCCPVEQFDRLVAPW